MEAFERIICYDAAYTGRDRIHLDPATQIAVTKAFDSSIAYVADREFIRLSAELSEQEIAERTLCALQALDGLQNNEMPNYNAWDALFYLTWYQPRQINLAYTLAREILNEQPFGGGTLQVVDFGCGALAMKFALALAAGDRLARGVHCPRIDIVPDDDSDAMLEIGKKAWCRFVNEIVKYPELNKLRRACKAITCNDQGNPTIRWLTALHVAYEEGAPEVNRILSERIEKQKPEVVLMTAHTKAARWAYSLDEDRDYKRDTHIGKDRNSYDLEMPNGCFEETAAFRNRLHRERIVTDWLSHQDKTLLTGYLSRSRGWRPPKFPSECRLYFRR